MLRKKERLKGVHSDLVSLWLALEADGHHMILVEGLRTEKRQRELVSSGASRTMTSKHLKQADGFSHATDVIPCSPKGEIDWDDTEAFRAFREVVLAKAKALGVRVRHGADWDMNNIIDELEIKAYIKKIGRRPLVDYPHWELVSTSKRKGK